MSAPIEIAPIFYDRTVFNLVLLISNVSLTLFASYVIITQSKSLGKFKYYILTQNIMGSCTSLVLIVGNPVFIPPHYCFFLAGFAREMKNTTAVLMFPCFFAIGAINTICIIVFSILNRYIHVFHPRYQHLFYQKYLILSYILITLAIELTIYYFTQSVFNTSHDESVAIALKDAQNAVSNYYNESTLTCLNRGNASTNILFIIALILSIIFNSSLIFITGLFVYSVKNTKTVILLKLSNSLYISTVSQTVLITVIIFTPVTIVAYIYAFQISNLPNIVNVLVISGSIHGTVDTLSMLYFVVPYRKYCLSLLHKNSRVLVISLPL